MSDGPLAALLRHARAVAGRSPADAADRRLLAAVAAGRDDAAFAALLDRYGPLVWAVVRRLLGGGPDAEDAFQATFLVLARSAGSVRHADRLAGWLVGVARRVALKARRAAADPIDPARADQLTAAGDDPADAAARSELQRLVTEELAGLPAKYRQPLVLCYLQGRTHRQAAADLGWPGGSVSRRVEKACALLRQRLARRGVAAPAAAVAAILAGDAAAVPPALAARAVRLAGLVAAGEVVTESPVLRLADGVAAAAAVTRWQAGRAAATVLLALGTGVGLLARPGPPPAGPAQPDLQPQAAAAQVETHGDPLPAGAVARLGSMRLRGGVYLTSVAFAPDGKSVAAGGSSGAVYLWDAATGRLRRSWDDGRGEVGPFGLWVHVRFSGDGTRLAAANERGPAVVRDVASGREVCRVGEPRTQVFRVWLSPDGRTAAYTHGQNNTIVLADAATGQTLRRLDGHTGHPQKSDVAFTPDGSKVVAVGEDTAAGVWDVATGRELCRLSGGGTSVGVAADGATATVVDAAKKAVTVYDLATGRATASRPVPDAGENGVYRVSADGRTVLIGQSRQVRLVDVAGGKETAIPCDVDIVWALALSPDGRALAAARNSIHDGRLRLVRVPTGEPVVPADGHGDGVLYLAFSPDGKLVATSDWAGVTRLWDAATGRPLRQWTGGGPLRFTPDGRELASGGGTRRAWDVTTGRQTHSVAGPFGTSWEAAFAPDGRTFTGRRKIGAPLGLWDLTTGRSVRELDDSTEFGTVAYSPDGRLIARGGNSGTVRVWDAATGKVLRDLAGHKGVVQGLAFSADGRLLATGGFDRTLRLWDLTTGREIWNRDGGLVSELVAISPDGRWIAGSGQHNRRVQLYEARTGSPRRLLIGHQGPVDGLAFSTDGGRLATGSSDGTALVWDLYAGFRGPPGDPLAPDQLAALWGQLDGPDAAAAFAAMGRLARRPADAVALVRERLRPATTAPAERTTPLIRDLDGPQFAGREGATRELEALGPAAERALRDAAAANPGPEARRRIDRLLERIEAGRVREARAVE
ncbi:MAG TPA: sigma-70 family RNA polymerase sigma factor, partial [Gemmataceae bacterium]